MSKSLKEVVTEKRKHMSFRANEAERKAIQKNADRYTKGNTAHWLRYAAMNHKPNQSELK